MHKKEGNKQNMMKENIEFQEIGKKIPYKVPEGFFEQIAEKTLQKAKQRTQEHRKRLVFLRTLAVVASAAAVLLLGIFIPGHDPKPESNLALQDKQPVEQTIIQKKPQTAKQQPTAEIRSKVAEPVSEKAIPEKDVIGETATEDIGDILADLSDDELSQLTVMYKTDPFIDDLSQDSIKTN